MDVVFVGILVCMVAAVWVCVRWVDGQLGEDDVQAP